jgi:dolichol-phosphate mannosyltransferase
MSRICLVMRPASGADPLGIAGVEAVREALSRAGYEVELARVEEIAADQWPWRAGARGEAAGIVSSWAKARTDLLLAIDPRMGYRPEDVVRLVERTAREPEVVGIGSRYGDSAPVVRRVTGKLLALLTGSTDPLAGLVCLSSGKFHEVALALQPVGPSIVPELLLKGGGATIDLPVASEVRRGPWPRGLDQVKQLKRLTNHRLGNLSRLAQFCMVGFSGMIVDLAAFALLGGRLSKGPLGDRVLEIAGWALDLSWVVAAGASISLALVWNFVLNRQLTFSDARKNSGLARQFLTYLLGNALAVSLSFVLRVGLPAWFGFFRDHRLAAAVVGVVLATGVSFSMSRWLVFRARPQGPAVPAPGPAPRWGRGRKEGLGEAAGREITRKG